MSEPTCMTWIGGRTNGVECGQSAVGRRGVRCLNGCHGEGQFEYFCADHDQFIADFKRGACAQCRNEVELFPVQRLVSS